MKPDYKNWMPKGMVASFFGGAAGSWIAAFLVRILMPKGTGRQVLTVLTTASGALFTGMSVWSYLMYRAFDYNGQRCADHCDRKAEPRRRGDRNRPLGQRVCLL